MPYIRQDILRPYIKDRIISEQSHPDAPWLRIYNYTNKATYDGIWDDVTMNCRGLVVDIEKECVVSACLKKFWNYEEHAKQGKPFPVGVPVVYEKLDGWYGSLYWLDGEPWVATRGSFMSPGAEWATAWIRAQFPRMSDAAQLELMRADVTHIFEIIAPCTRIVVQYSYVGLVHLATLQRETGADCPLSDLGLWQAGVVQAADYQTLCAMDAENAEGFVCHWPEAALRLKIKFAKYVELHALYMQTSAHTLWKQLYDGGIVLGNMPEDLQQWTETRMGQLIDARSDYEYEVVTAYREIRKNLSRTWGKDKTARDKAIGMAIQAHPLRGMLMLYHRYQDALWKAVEPVGSETFRNDGEDL